MMEAIDHESYEQIEEQTRMELNMNLDEVKVFVKSIDEYRFYKEVIEWLHTKHGKALASLVGQMTETQ